ncbi:glycosyltransferase family 39 protein [Patescibacteria group bacterium]|nr:glycosyltransferase family 39 protein [Patescibacteria group bacterium]
MMKKSVYLLIIIMALAVFFRLWQITSIPPGLYPDEAMNGNNASEALQTGEYKVFYPENNGREGLFANLEAISIKIFGNEPWALRLISAIFGILTVLGLYLLTKELFNNRTIALLASFFMATSFWHIMFSRIGFRAIMAPAFLVWSMWLLWRLLGDSVSKQTWRLSLQALLSGLLFGLGFHSYIAYRIAPLLLIPLFLILLKNKKIKPLIIFCLGVFIAVLPLLIFFTQNPQDFFGRTSQISIFSSESPIKELAINVFKTIGMFFWFGDANWRHNFAGAPELWLPVAILFLIGILIGIWKLFKNFSAASGMKIGNLYEKFTSPEFFLLLWIAVMLLPVVISSEGIPHALRAIIVIPPTMIFCALGLNWIIEKFKNWNEKQIIKFPNSQKQLLRIKKEVMVLLFVFLITVASFTFIQYFFKWAYNPDVYYAFNENYAKIGRYLNNTPQDIKKYVIINAGGVEVNNIPMPSQTIMFITNTFLPDKQKEKNIYYITEKKLDNFIEEAKNENNIQIIMLENNSELRQKLSDNIPGLYSYQDSSVLIQTK